MSISSTTFAYFLLASLIATLAWIGWRFFYIQAPEPRPQAPRIQPPRPALEPRVRWIFPPELFRPSQWIALFRGPQALWLLVPILVTGFTVAFTLVLSRHQAMDPLSADGIGPDVTFPHPLDPPQPLPPLIFIGTEDPFLETADRDWKRLDGTFTQYVLLLFQRMENRGYPMALLEGYRSPERQQMLYEQGSQVTRAKAGQSKHQYGLAVDLAFLRDGRLVISDKDQWAATAYRALGEEAEALGLTWGGRWAMRDLGHVESRTKASAATQPPGISPS